MRHLFAMLATAVVVASMAGCTGSRTTDPYELTRTAMEAEWDRVQVEVGIDVKTYSNSFTIDPSAIRLVIDNGAGKGSLDISLPASELGIGAGDLAQIGITGRTIDLEVLFDGNAVYLRSPVVGTLIGMLYAQSGETPPKNLTDWLRLGTPEDLAGLAAMAGPSAPPSPQASSSLDTATFKKDLEANGIVLTYAGSEKHAGVDCDHISAAIDVEKLTANEAFDSLSRQQLNQVTDFAKDATVSADLWIDSSKDRVVELALHLAGKPDPARAGDTGDKAEVTITLAEPPAGTTFDAPAQFTELPIQELVGSLLELVGGSLLGG